MSAAQTFPQDQALPHLTRALDPQAMLEVFTDAMRGHSARIVNCLIERVKYRPSKNCSVSYMLNMCDGATGKEFEQRVAARLCSGGESARRAVRGSNKRFQSSLAGPAMRLLPELDMLTWWWPNDATLAAPRVLADPRTMREQVLPEVVAVLSEGRGTLVDYHLQVAQYIPEQRVCARVDLSWQIDGQVVDQCVYAKSSLDPDSAAAHRVLRSLQESAAWRAGSIRTPRALLWQSAFGLHWQQGLPGRSLLNIAANEVGRFVSPLGAQLAALHATPIGGVRETTREALHLRLTAVNQLLHQTLPDSSSTLLQLTKLLTEGLHFLDGVSQVTLHGDLLRCNILAHGDQISLIDLDNLHRGPALLELGAWVSDSMYFAVLNADAPTKDMDEWEALLDSYAASGGRRPQPKALAWAVAWNLLTQRASRCVANLKPGRFSIAPRLIELAARIASLQSLEGARC
jgi:aminoglycoside phosphotransferase (APT) family kinase protein